MVKYMEIARDILNAVQAGQLAASDKLPSIIQQAKSYDCSRGTVVRAYQFLMERNIVYVKNKSGYYIAAVPSVQCQEEGYHLESGNPMVGAFPLSYAKQSLSLALDEYHLESLDIGHDGVPSVIHMLSEKLADSFIYTDSDGLYLTMGIQGVMYTLCKMPFPNKRKNILLEEPGYAFVIDLMKAYQDGKIFTIRRTVDGYDLKELERIFAEKEIKFFYLTPRNHNPLGTSLSSQQRKKIIALAQKYDVYLAEDDYFMDAFYIPNYEPLYYLSGGDHCIYLGSFTKILPYLRIGFTIMPPELQNIYVDTVNYLMMFGYYIPPLISQTMLGVLLSNNSFEISKNLLRHDLRDKIDTVQKYTQNWPEHLLHYTGYHGYYASIRLNPLIPVEQFIEDLEKQNIYVRSNLSSFFHEEYFDNSLRVSLAKISSEEIPEIYPIFLKTAESFYNKNKIKRTDRRESKCQNHKI